MKGFYEWCIWIRFASLDQGQGHAILWILFSNSNELKGIWSVLYNESWLEQICHTLRHGSMSSNIKKAVFLFIRMISIDI